MFGSPDITTGGNALKFYASVRMEIKRTGQVKGKGENEIVGNLIRVKVAKNKMAPPFRVADFEMTYGKGVSKSGEVVDLGLTSGVLGRSGAWYTFVCPKTAAAVNEALAAGASGQEASPAPATFARPALTTAAGAAKAPKGSKKTTAAAAAAAAAAAESAAAEDAAATAAAAAAQAASKAAAAAPGLPLPPETVQVGAPFAQGRDKAKAWFEARPGAMAAAAAAVKAALLAGGGRLPSAAPGAIAAVGLAAAPLPGVASLEDELEGTLPGVGAEEE